MAKLFFTFISYGIDQAQQLHVLVKQVSKLYLDLLGHKPKDRFSIYAALPSVAAHERASCLCGLFINFEKSLIQIRPYISGLIRIKTVWHPVVFLK